MTHWRTAERLEIWAEWQAMADRHWRSRPALTASAVAQLIERELRATRDQRVSWHSIRRRIQKVEQQGAWLRGKPLNVCQILCMARLTGVRYDLERRQRSPQRRGRLKVV